MEFAYARCSWGAQDQSKELFVGKCSWCLFLFGQAGRTETPWLGSPLISWNGVHFFQAFILKRDKHQVQPVTPFTLYNFSVQSFQSWSYKCSCSCDSSARNYTLNHLCRFCKFSGHPMLHCPKRKMPISGLQWLDIQSVGLSQCTDLEMDYDTDTKSENNFLLKHKSLSRLERNVPAISNRSKRLWISWFSVGRFFFFDTRCPFGLRSPVLICQRTTRAVIHVFTNGGYTADVYLNNFYGTEHLSTASAAFERLQELFDELG